MALSALARKLLSSTHREESKSHVWKEQAVWLMEGTLGLPGALVSSLPWTDLGRAARVRGGVLSRVDSIE